MASILGGIGIGPGKILGVDVRPEKGDVLLCASGF